MRKLSNILLTFALFFSAMCFVSSTISFSESNIIVLILSIVGILLGLRLFFPFFASFYYDLFIGVATIIFVILNLHEDLPNGSWPLIFSSWLYSWLAVEKIMQKQFETNYLSTIRNFVAPIFFGVWIIFFWEVATVGLKIPVVILPSPSVIGIKFVASLDILWADFIQTFVKSALIGYLIGCSSGLLIAILIDSSPFLKRGLLPIGNFISALPIIGVAPIMVMWFGFDWESKAAVVVIMTFFPMLVNTITGLSISSQIEKDIMKTYGASYSQTLFFLRLHGAAPFIFNALKINSTLALIGAIVAEFFGTPIVGVGFRISTEVGRMNLDMVWAEITVAALVGTITYGIITFIEKRLTFWHPSIRGN